MIGLRFSNVMEPGDYARFPAFDDDPGSRKWNLWGYIDARDGAQAVRLALESELTGTEVFIIANADTVMSRPNAALVKEFFIPTSRCVATSESTTRSSRSTKPDGCSAMSLRTIWLGWRVVVISVHGLYVRSAAQVSTSC